MLLLKLCPETGQKWKGVKDQRKSSSAYFVSRSTSTQTKSAMEDVRNSNSEFRKLFLTGVRFMKTVTLPGAEGIKQAYAESLKSDKLDIVCLSENYESVLGDYFDKDYAPGLYEKVTREILRDTAGNRTDARKKDQRRNQVRFIKTGASESDFLLYDDKAVFISYDSKQPGATVIEDKEIVANLKSQFAALWQSLT